MIRYRKILVAIVVLICAIPIWLLVLPGGNSRNRAEREHGIRLPPSADHIQCRGDAWHGFLDRGAVTMFEMKTNDLAIFVSQLQVRSRTAPARTRTIGDPTINGWNVWPKLSATFVPGSDQYGGLRQTWHGAATPVEMLSCSSPKGDWLYVEIWRVEDDTMVVKMYTDWN